MRSSRGADIAASRGETLPSDNLFLKSLGLELAYFSGCALLMQRRSGRAGVILRFERVRPRRTARFQPLKACEITPEFLDRTIGALRALEIRYRFNGRGLPEGGYAGLAEAVCVPDVRWRL
jgi:hypothetical protein